MSYMHLMSRTRRRGVVRIGLPLTPPQVELRSQYSLNSDATLTSGTGPNGTIVGTADNVATLNDDDSGGALYFDGTAYATLPGGNPAHDAANLANGLGVLIYLQLHRLPTAEEVKFHIACAEGNSASPGSYAWLEILSDGSARGYQRDGDNIVRWWSDTGGDAIPGLTFTPGRAYRIFFSFGGLKDAELYVDDTLVATMGAQNVWDNSLTKFWGSWVDGTSSRLVGILDEIRVYHGRLSQYEIESLPGPQDATLPGGEIGDIVLAPITMWADEKGNGEHKITDTAIGGTIASASGGALPAFPITVDPTPYVSNAAGSKSGWTVQFQGSTLGTWTKLGNGDFQFTPSTTPGLDQSQYRVSDDGGATFSPWAPLETRVLDRTLCPGPYFLVEDYAGSDTAKLNAARDAAVAAGGGTVTTLDRATSMQDINNHALKPRVHYLFISAKHPASKHTSGAFCSTSSPNGQCSGWTPTQNDQIWNGVPNRNAIVDTGVRINMVGGTWDGNSFMQTLFQTSGAAPTPSSTCGTCWPGARTTSDTYNLQFKSIIKMQGKASALAADRALYGIYGVYFLDSAADGIRGVGAVDLIAEDLIMEGQFRGALVLDGGNIKRRSKRLRVINDNDNIGGGIDDEMLTYNSTRFGDFIDTDMYCAQDFDQVIRDNSTYIHEGGEVGPAISLLSRTTQTGGNRPTFIFRGSAARPRAIMYYHGRNGGAGEWHRINGWAGDSPHACLWQFIDTDFITWGPPYVKHARLFTPAAGQTWSIDLAQNVNTGDAFEIHLINCSAQVGPGMPAGNKTIKLFSTLKALTTAQVMRIDGLTIASGFQQAAITLNGQRLEYRNVVHQGFPGSTIQQICPGAGQYVAL